MIKYAERMKGSQFIVVVALVASMAFSISFASDPSPLQDYCVAIDDIKDGVFMNGKFCKDPNIVKVEDFFFSGLNIPREPVKLYGSKVTLLTADVIPGLNTLGLSQVRIDFAPGGVNPPHIHPRASEILTVLEGTLYAGFVSSNQNNNTLFTKVLYPGDVIVFPFGLIHFQFNIGEGNAIAYATLSSQNPGVITLGNAIFASKPLILPNVIAKAYQLDKHIVQELQSRSWTFNT